MTLKKCTVTQLDNTFWRVDFAGWLSVGERDVSSPQVVRRFGECWFVQGYPHESANGLHALLARLGLAAEQPAPETAEGRVRAWMEGRRDAEDVDAGFTVADLRAVLAELDRLRAREAKFALGPSVDAVLAPIRGVVAKLWESAKGHESARLLEMDCGDRKEEAWHSARAVSYEAAARRVEAAIAEAEKVARDE